MTILCGICDVVFINMFVSAVNEYQGQMCRIRKNIYVNSEMEYNFPPMIFVSPPPLCISEPIVEAKL